MMVPESAMTGGLVVLALASAWFDVRERRVPNTLTVGGLVAALAFAALGGGTAFAAALAGAGIAFIIGLPVFLAGGLGGGDVKLLAAIGAFLGPRDLPFALVAIAIIGGVMAAVEMVRQQAIGRTLTNLGLILGGLGRETFSRWKRRGADEPLTVDSAGAVTVPYAVAIAAGAILTRVLL